MHLSYPFRLPLLALGLLAAAPALAQTTPADTTHLQYAEEVAAITPAQVQQAPTQQWKLGLNNFTSSNYPFKSGNNFGPYYTRYGLHLAYERRVGKNWSVQAEASPAVTYTLPDGATSTKAGFAMRAQVAGRYYYNQERRLRLGRSISPFIGNYISAAVGTGLGKGPVRETPFYFIRDASGAMADVALLYGLQRRLGRYVFVDANAGLSAFMLSTKLRQVGLNASLRVGLALPEANSLPSPKPFTEVNTLLPRFYIGAQTGLYYYRVSYSNDNPYLLDSTTPHGTDSWQIAEPLYAAQGTYDQEVPVLPYLYAGYYLTPRLAVQIGAQYASVRQEISRVYVSEATYYPPNRYVYTIVASLPNVIGREHELAVPIQVRYALTRVLQRRLQLDALGGLTPLWSSWHVREYEIANRAVTDKITNEFRRSAFGIHGSLGLAAEYGFGRRRRVQAVVEGAVIKNLKSFRIDNNLSGGMSLGLRYRFGYR